MEFKEMGESDISLGAVRFMGLVIFLLLLISGWESIDGWFEVLKAVVVSLIVLPLVIRLTDYLRKMAKPEVILTDGFWDTIGKKFFWSYGVFIPAIVISLFIVLRFVPDRIIIDHNATEVESYHQELNSSDIAD